MRTLPYGLAILLSISCAGSPVSQDVRRIVPLIKAEKYEDAAADPDLLAPAFLQALHEMKAEGADPKRIVRVADFFFDNYPFSVQDLAVDESLFIEITELQYDVLTRLVPETQACAEFRRLRTPAELFSADELIKGHEDGGRCARHVFQIFRTATRDGYRTSSGIRIVSS